jgi:hypothetical protein
MQKTTLVVFLVACFVFHVPAWADPVTDVAKGSVDTVSGVTSTSIQAVGTVTGETLDVAGQSGMSVVHHGVLGTVVRLIVIPFKALEYTLTGTRGLKGLHNVITRPYEGP